MGAELEVHFGLTNVTADLVVPMDDIKTWSAPRYAALIEALGTLIDLVHAPKWADPITASVGAWPTADYGNLTFHDLTVSDEGTSDDVVSTPVGDGDGQTEPEPAAEGQEEDSAGTAGVGERAEPSPATTAAKRKPGPKPKAKKPAPPAEDIVPRDPPPDELDRPLGANGRDLLLMVKMIGGYLEADDVPLHRTVAERLDIGSGVALTLLERLVLIGHLNAERDGRKIQSVELTESGRRELDAA